MTIRELYEYGLAEDKLDFEIAICSEEIPTHFGGEYSDGIDEIIDKIAYEFQGLTAEIDLSCEKYFPEHYATRGTLNAVWLKCYDAELYLDDRRGL